MEDIKILEGIKAQCAFIRRNASNPWEKIQHEEYYDALENAIKALKERQADKEKIKELEAQNKFLSKQYDEMFDDMNKVIEESLVKEKFRNTRKELLSQTLINDTDRYWMDKCLEYINNLEKELLEEG